jgi:hypothetical protein
VQLTSPHGNRAVSLQERQAEMLREKIKALEHRIMDMVRHGNENMVIADRMQRWANGLLTTRDRAACRTASRSRCSRCSWCRRRPSRCGTAPALPERAYAQWVSDDVKAFATSLTSPYCGLNSGFEAANWLPDPARGDVDRADSAARRMPNRRPSACWCWRRPTRSASTPRWAPTSSSASPSWPRAGSRGCVLDSAALAAAVLAGRAAVRLAAAIVTGAGLCGHRRR